MDLAWLPEECDATTIRGGIDPKRPNRKYIDRRCIVCGEVHPVLLSRLKLTVRNGTYTGACKSCRATLRRGEHHPNWKGGQYLDSAGYVRELCKDHPYAFRDGYVLQHRLVMEERLGRYLEPNETVHHKDGNRQNNDPDNLELWTGNHGNGVRAEDAWMEPDWTQQILYLGLSEA